MCLETKREFFFWQRPLLHIAHIEADVPLFSKHLWNLAIPRKLWVPAHSEVRRSGTMTAKKSVF